MTVKRPFQETRQESVRSFSRPRCPVWLPQSTTDPNCKVPGTGNLGCVNLRRENLNNVGLGQESRVGCKILSLAYVQCIAWWAAPSAMLQSHPYYSCVLLCRCSWQADLHYLLNPTFPNLLSLDRGIWSQAIMLVGGSDTVDSRPSTCRRCLLVRDPTLHTTDDKCSQGVHIHNCLLLHAHKYGDQ